MIRRLALTALVVPLLGACATAEADLSPAQAGDTLHLPAAHLPGGIYTRLCAPPPGAPPGRLVVINHGSPPDPAVRPAMRPASCQSEAVRWFTARGHLVAIPMRRGYGQTGGAWAEGYGNCNAPDYARAGRETARDILATVRAMQARPGTPAGPAIVVGQSAGGWGALALASAEPLEVGRVINMAGGRGGRNNDLPNNVCRPERLVSATSALGLTARMPTLWIYAANDSFFGPALARDMAAAWRLAGAPVAFRPMPAFGRDGHGLFFGQGGSAIWGSEVEAFLR
ncbi:MAG: prolyl oligopeptidase family serine peptidase [Roseococcus sp.]